MPNFRYPGDQKKVAMLQDAMLQLAIANDQNIATARQNLKRGLAPVQLTLEQSKTPAELIQDTSKMYACMYVCIHACTREPMHMEKQNEKKLK